MITTQKQFGALLVGLYAWFLAVMAGMVLLDILYARRVSAAGAFSGAADLLLLGMSVVIVTAVAAIPFAWKTTAARNLLVASALVMMLELFLPAIVAVLGWNGPVLTAAGPWLRIAISGTASVLAFLGMGQYLRG